METTKENLGIIVPAYNEEKTISQVLDQILPLDFVGQVIIVDDASTDGTSDILNSYEHPKIEIIKKRSNKGKTAAIKSALPHINTGIVLILDADLEYDPQELSYLCDPIWRNKADVVYGSRFLVRQASRVLYFYHYLANKSLTFICNLFTNKNMTDIESGYKAFRTPILQNIPITSSGFGFEVEVTASVSKTKARIYETPISYYGRTYEEGKKINYKDGILALWYIFKYNLKSTRQTRQSIETINAYLDKRI